jgi:hypothetical protein
MNKGSALKELVGGRMEPLRDRLVKFIVTSAKPKVKFEAVRRAVALLEGGPQDLHAPQGDSSTLNALLALGVVRRGRDSRTVELAVDRGELRSTIAELEGLISDNVILAEKLEAGPPYPMYMGGLTERVLLGAWYMRSGWEMASLPKLSRGSVRVGPTTYYIVPRSALADILLHICVTREYDFGRQLKYNLLRVYWEPPDSLYERVMEGKSRRGLTVAHPEELSHYAFDRKIRLEREILDEMADISFKEARRLRDILFDLGEDEGEHSRIVNCLVSVGGSLGYEAKKEVDIGGGRIDVAWYRGGAPECSFEVVLDGSLEEALFKLGRVGGRRFLVVREGDRAHIEERAERLSFEGRILEAERVEAASQSLELLRQIMGELSGE